MFDGVSYTSAWILGWWARNLFEQAGLESTILRRPLLIEVKERWAAENIFCFCNEMDGIYYLVGNLIMGDILIHPLRLSCGRLHSN